MLGQCCVSVADDVPTLVEYLVCWDGRMIDHGHVRKL